MKVWKVHVLTWLTVPFLHLQIKVGFVTVECSLSLLFNIYINIKICFMCGFHEQETVKGMWICSLFNAISSPPFLLSSFCFWSSCIWWWILKNKDLHTYIFFLSWHWENIYRLLDLGLIRGLHYNFHPIFHMFSSRNGKSMH
jgi:hypothetical protein